MQLVATGLLQSFGDLTILRGVDFEINTGQRAAIVGPSGSGKSSLLALLGGLARPRSGMVEVRQHQTLLKGRAVRQAVSWVLQTTTVLGARSALANTELAARFARVPGSRRESLAALAAVDLTDAADRPARLLSGGELQRLAIARALASHKPFILADEPTGQLDRHTSDLVLDRLVDAVEHTGAGLILVTHDEAAMQRFETVYRLNDGQLEL